MVFSRFKQKLSIAQNVCSNPIFFRISIVVIIIAAALMIFPDFFMYSGTDYGVYFNNGRLISEGKLPYRDFWDHKTPGMYWYLAAWQFFFGTGWYSAKVALIPVYSLLGISIFFFSKVTIKRNSIAIFSSLVCIYFTLRLGFDPARNGAILGLSTSFELLALSLIFLVSAQTTEQHTPRKTILCTLAAGVLSSTAFLIRQTSIVPFLVLSLLFVIAYIGKKRQKIGFILISFATGALLPLLTMILWAIAGGLKITDIYEATVLFNRVYASKYASLGSLVGWMRIFRHDILWWIPALSGLLYLIRKEGNDKITFEEKAGLSFTYLCLGVAVMLAITGMKAQEYYKIQYLPYLFILAGVVVLFLTERYPKKPSTVLVITTFIAGLFAINSLFLIAQSDFSALRRWYGTASAYDFEPSNFPDQAIAQQVLSRTDDQTIYVYGNRAWIYLLTGTTSPNKYYYSSGMFLNGYLSESEFNNLIEELQTTPPSIIVYWASHPDASSNLYNCSYIERFEDFVSENYILDGEFSFDAAWPYQLSQPVMIYVLQ